MADKDTLIEERTLPLSDEMKVRGATLIKPRIVMEPPKVNLDELFHKLKLSCRRRRTISAKKIAQEIVGVSKCTSEILARFIFSRPRKSSYDAVAKIFGDEIRDCATNCKGPSFSTLLHIAVASHRDHAFGQCPDWWWEKVVRPRFEAIPRSEDSPFNRRCMMKIYRVRLAQLSKVSKAYATYVASHLP